MKENIYTFAKHLHGDDPTRYVPWAESLIALAENSRTDELLGKLAEYKGMKLPPALSAFTPMCTTTAQRLTTSPTGLMGIMSVHAQLKAATR